jgi:hypothetical protein
MPRRTSISASTRCVSGSIMRHHSPQAGLGSHPPHLHRDWAHRYHICIGTGLAPAPSALGLGSPAPSELEWAHPMPYRPAARRRATSAFMRLRCEYSSGARAGGARGRGEGAEPLPPQRGVGAPLTTIPGTLNTILGTLNAILGTLKTTSGTPDTLPCVGVLRCSTLFAGCVMRICCLLQHACILLQPAYIVARCNLRINACAGAGVPQERRGVGLGAGAGTRHVSRSVRCTADRSAAQYGVRPLCCAQAHAHTHTHMHAHAHTRARTLTHTHERTHASAHTHPLPPHVLRQVSLGVLAAGSTPPQCAPPTDLSPFALRCFTMRIPRAHAHAHPHTRAHTRTGVRTHAGTHALSSRFPPPLPPHPSFPPESPLPRGGNKSPLRQPPGPRNARAQSQQVSHRPASTLTRLRDGRRGRAGRARARAAHAHTRMRAQARTHTRAHTHARTRARRHADAVELFTRAADHGHAVAWNNLAGELVVAVPICLHAHICMYVCVFIYRHWHR